jgi:ribosomal protein S17
MAKTIIGTVSSDKTDKTIVVTVDRIIEKPVLREDTLAATKAEEPKKEVSGEEE